MAVNLCYMVGLLTSFSEVTGTQALLHSAFLTDHLSGVKTKKTGILIHGDMLKHKGIESPSVHSSHILCL